MASTPASEVPVVPPQFSQLSLTVDCARLNGTSGLLKPNPYVEVIVDGKPPRKTDTQKSTYQPKWEDELTLLVTPYSKLLFRLYDHSLLKKDTLLGEETLELYSLLRKHNGKCDKTVLSLDLHSNASRSTASKMGELVVVLDGLHIDMSLIPAASPPVVSVAAPPYHASPPATDVPNGSSGGVRPRPPRPPPPVANGITSVPVAAPKSSKKNKLPPLGKPFKSPTSDSSSSNPVGAEGMITTRVYLHTFPFDILRIRICRYFSPRPL